MSDIIAKAAVSKIVEMISAGIVKKLLLIEAAHKLMFWLIVLKNRTLAKSVIRKQVKNTNEDNKFLFSASSLRIRMPAAKPRLKHLAHVPLFHGG